MVRNFTKIILIFLIIFSNAQASENKIIAKVQNSIITTMDIVDEINNLTFFNKKFEKINSNEKYEIALQSLIKYKIKEIEVKNELKEVALNNNEYLDDIIKDNYKFLGFENLNDFKNGLKNNEINFEDYVEKIKIDILWNQIIYTKYYDKIVIDENKLREKIKNQKEISIEFNLSEILFQVDNLKQLNSTHILIKNDIKNLGFENTAVKNSISSTSSNGGSLGWVNEKIINEKILEKLNKLQIGETTEPIRIASGFLILRINDLRKIEKKIDVKEELNNLINNEKEKQLSTYSNLYYNKVKKNMTINAP